MSASESAKIVLKSADQYHLWKARIHAACWAATRLAVFDITDEECARLSKTFDESKAENKSRDVVGMAWTIITQSLHDELFIKLVHVKSGLIQTLMGEIRSALLVNIAEDIQPLRLELYGASMQRDCNNDLQSFIAYVTQRRDKLLFLKIKVPDEELVNIFLKGLPSIFLPLQVHYGIPGNTEPSFDGIIATVRRFASNPVVAAELAKMKSAGLSQNVFTSISRAMPTPTNTQKERPYCFRYSKTGSCKFGDKCRFYHANSSGNGQLSGNTVGSNTNTGGERSRQHSIECGYCHNRGHTMEECRKRARNRHPTTLSATVEEKEQPQLPNHPALTASHEGDEPYVFVFTLGSGEGNITGKQGWVLDSGATTSATHYEEDCIDITPCNIKVTAAGSEFIVTRKGTAVINCVDPNGVTQKILVRNCLISEKFPYKLLALSKFAKRGYSALIKDETITITNPQSNLTLIAQKDPKSKLFFLRQTLTQTVQEVRNPISEEQGGSIANCSNFSIDPHSVSLARAYTDETDLLWKLHLRHGHRNFEDLCRQYKITPPAKTPACTSCVMGKAHIHPFISSGFIRATRVAEGFHSDFRGPFSCTTPAGHAYLLTIIDDYSRRIFAFLVKSQSEWFDIWTKFVTRIEAELGKTNCISWLITDNGTVYKSASMVAYCALKGIQQLYSAPYSQFMDHTAERNMRTIGEMITTTLIHANLPHRAWGWAALHAAEVLNRTTESAASNKVAGTQHNFSRLERWKGRELPTQTKGLYPFGCLAFKLVPGALRTKLDPHAVPCVYLGMDNTSRSFLLGSLFDLNTSVSVEVTFFEDNFPFRKHKQESSPLSLLWNSDPLASAVDSRIGRPETAVPTAPEPMVSIKSLLEERTTSEDQKTKDQAIPTVGSTAVVHPAHDEPSGGKETEPEPAPTLRRSTRVIVPRTFTNQKYREPVASKILLCFHSFISPIENVRYTLNTITEASLGEYTPRTASEALASPQAEMWKEAMQREKACHIKNHTFGNALPPPNVKSVPADWVFKIKHRGGPINIRDLAPLQYKARVVVRGDYMQEGLEFNDTFAPVAKPATLRAVLALAAKFKCRLYSGDVETAFLTADMDCEAWVRMPPHWGAGDEAISHANVPQPPRQLLKGVPGIPQGSRLFYQTFTKQLKVMGYIPTLADKCLFTSPHLQELTAVLLWVDDFIFLCQNLKTWDKFIKELRSVFNIPCAGELQSFLGMNIVRDIERNYLAFNQQSSVTVLLERGGMTDSNPTLLPCVTGAVFTKADSPETPTPDATHYRSLVAMANFLSCWSRPDITFVVNKLCKFMSNPGPTHWGYLKHLLRYLAGTRELGIVYDFESKAKCNSLHGYCDSSFADCPDTSRSTLAYAFFYDNALLSWYSKLGTYVTTCTNHSEYNALALGGKEAEWMAMLLEELDKGRKYTPIPIFVDNAGVISMVYNPVEHQANKHVRVGCHYSRELVERKIIIPQRVPSESNIADLFTKSLGTTTFNRLTSIIMGQIKKESKPKGMDQTSEAAMMLRVHEEDSDEEQGGLVDDFQQRWLYLAAMKARLGAASYTVNDNAERYSTGRKKYEVCFYKFGRGGDKRLISKHDAMQLISKSGNAYYVCSKTPTIEPPLEYEGVPEPPNTPKPPSITISTVMLQQQQPGLQCVSCANCYNIDISQLQCMLCSGKEFKWGCGYTASAEVKQQQSDIRRPTPAEPVEHPAEVKQQQSGVRRSIVAEPTVHLARNDLAVGGTEAVKTFMPTDQEESALRPKRAQIQKSWVEKIKYHGPVRNNIQYHSLECFVDRNAVTMASIEYANAYRMTHAPCCAPY